MIGKCHFRRATDLASLCFRGGAGSRGEGGGGPKRRKVGSRRDPAGVLAAVIVRGPSRPPSLARARGVRRELAGYGQGSGTPRVLGRREGRGGAVPESSPPSRTGPLIGGLAFAFPRRPLCGPEGAAAPTLTRAGGGVGHGGNQRPGSADRATAALRAHQRERSQGPVRQGQVSPRARRREASRSPRGPGWAD